MAEILTVVIVVAAIGVMVLLLDPSHESCQPVDPVRRIGGDE